MHNALRARENPALDVAISLASTFDLPLLVYQGLCEHYPYASDRHHAFILQGARDVHQNLAARGIRSVFHLQHRGNRGPHLKELVSGASVMVTELMPVEPILGWLERLSATTTTPILSVDTACVVPMPLVQRPYDRAYHFRDATKRLREERLRLPWPEHRVDCRPYEGPLPFTPLDLSHADLARLIGECEIDHMVAPVGDTVGGSRAGMARWEEYKQHGLAAYEKIRNDAARNASSRMSAYLHYGMVSPMLLARDAAAVGAEKFLDELLIWREMAYHFCFHRHADLESFDALPDWARKTLAAHRQDRRMADWGWEELARGQTGQPLWDACQRSLLKHGELHNNVRMTWGKALLPWSKTAERALLTAIDLNHRYALDGRDPCSYGGVLWCFGQFDRPAEENSPVLGTIRPRPLDDHQRRIDMDQFNALVDRSIAPHPPRVAVIGAGIAGLVAARTLADHGLQPMVFEKSRGVGGRLSTRRAPSGAFFDHGAQYFTIRDKRFAKYVCAWMGEGLVVPWHGRIVEIREGQVVAEKSSGVSRYVPTPSMNALARHLARDVRVTFESCVAEMEQVAGGWRLVSDSGSELGVFDAVIVNCPAPQAAALVPGEASFRGQLSGVTMEPCWAVLAELEQPLQVPFQGAFIHDSPLAWIAEDSSKPGRPQKPTWVMHASGAWSWEHLEDDPDEVLAELLDAFTQVTGEVIGEAVTLAAHRWRYAKATAPLEESSLWDPRLRIGACGDWCRGGRIEGAFLSGASMAGEILRQWTLSASS